MRATTSGQSFRCSAKCHLCEPRSTARARSHAFDEALAPHRSERETGTATASHTSASSRALGLAAQGGRSQTARPRPRAWPAEHRRVESVSGENSTSARKRPTLAHPRTRRSSPEQLARHRARPSAEPLRARGVPQYTAATRAHKSPTIDTCQASVRLGLVLPLHLGDREHASIADPCSARKRESMNNPIAHSAARSTRDRSFGEGCQIVAKALVGEHGLGHRLYLKLLAPNVTEDRGGICRVSLIIIISQPEALVFRLAEHDAARLPGSGRREQARKLGPVSHPKGMAALRENAPLALDAISMAVMRARRHACAKSPHRENGGKGGNPPRAVVISLGIS